jgi:hypothetical protein
MDDVATYTIEVRGENIKILEALAHKAFRDPDKQASAMLDNALRVSIRTRTPRPARRPTVQRAA